MDIWRCKLGDSADDCAKDPNGNGPFTSHVTKDITGPDLTGLKETITVFYRNIIEIFLKSNM